MVFTQRCEHLGRLFNHHDARGTPRCRFETKGAAAGEQVDEQIAVLRKLLSQNDIIIDAGNANFRDTIRRFDELKDTGLTFIGMGVSGGEEGARKGPDIMPGGPG